MCCPPGEPGKGVWVGAWVGGCVHVVGAPAGLAAAPGRASSPYVSLCISKPKAEGSRSHPRSPLAAGRRLYETWMVLEYCDRGSLTELITAGRFVSKLTGDLDEVRGRAALGREGWRRCSGYSVVWQPWGRGLAAL